MSAFKQPVSVLVVIHDPGHRILLLERTAPTGFWQSVTGSLEPGETPLQAAVREVAEETGIRADALQLTDWQLTRSFEIKPAWRHRYAPGVILNTEHVFSLCVAPEHPVRLAPAEHRAWGWYSMQEALERVSSWTNRLAIEELRHHAPPPRARSASDMARRQSGQ